MKILIYLSLFPLLFSCSSKSPDVPPTPVDTLTTGWKKITMPESSFSDIFFINNNVGYVGGTSIYRSTDGGNNWQKVYQPSVGISNIAMGSEANSIFITGNGQVIVTRNGGVSFDIVTINDVISDAFFCEC